MSYLNNRTIVVDATLTNIGRQRFAEGNFNITKFALADDEIDYSLYNFNHPNGTAYYDEAILATPILEPVVDESSLMKSKLFTPDSSQPFVGNIPTVVIDNKVGAASYLVKWSSGTIFNSYRDGNLSSTPYVLEYSSKWKHSGTGVETPVYAQLIKLQFLNGPTNAIYDVSLSGQADALAGTFLGINGMLYKTATLSNTGVTTGTNSDSDYVYIAFDMTKFDYSTAGPTLTFELKWRETTTGLSGVIPFTLSGFSLN